MCKRVCIKLSNQQQLKGLSVGDWLNHDSVAVTRKPGQQYRWKKDGAEDQKLGVRATLYLKVRQIPGNEQLSEESIFRVGKNM